MAYDVFQQTDFTQDERILEQLKLQFKNETMRAEQYRLYQMSMKTVSIFFDILPFYLTWFILIIVFLREDVSIFDYLKVQQRRKAKLIITLGCVCLAALEGYTQINYGDPDYMDGFERFKQLFPENFTMKDIVRLILLIIMCLVTILTQYFPSLFLASNPHFGLYC